MTVKSASSLSVRCPEFSTSSVTHNTVHTSTANERHKVKGKAIKLCKVAKCKITTSQVLLIFDCLAWVLEPGCEAGKAEFLWLVMKAEVARRVPLADFVEGEAPAVTSTAAFPKEAHLEILRFPLCDLRPRALDNNSKR